MNTSELPFIKTCHVISVTSRSLSVCVVLLKRSLSAYAERDNRMKFTSLFARRVEDVLSFMQDKHVSFMDLLTYILDGGGPCRSSYRRRVHFDNLESTLTRID